MMTLTASDARSSFFELIKKANIQHDLFEIRHKSGNVVMLLADKYESLQETLFLLSQPNFKAEFDRSVAEADAGKTIDFKIVFDESQ